MTPLQRVEGAAGAMKVFPLPSAVLLPSAAVPLHIFEPRYRELVTDALAGDKVLALAQLDPGWEPHYHGSPRIRPLLCAGVIGWSEKLPDGRFNILLQGVIRARLLEELPSGKLYRTVRVQLLPDPPIECDAEEQLRRAALDLATSAPQAVAQALLHLAAKTRGGGLADVIAGGIVGDVDRRYELLCELDVEKRLRAVLDDVSEAIVRLSPARPKGPMN